MTRNADAIPANYLVTLKERVAFVVNDVVVMASLLFADDLEDKLYVVAYVEPGEEYLERTLDQVRTLRTPAHVVIHKDNMLAVHVIRDPGVPGPGGET